MKRLIRYLYEYEDGERTRNVGFVKVEAGSEETMIHIHGKGIPMERNSELVLYLFFEEEKMCKCIRQMEIRHETPVMNYHLQYTRKDTGVPENYDKIKGLMLDGESGRRYVALWDEVEADICSMQAWEPKPEPEPEMVLESKEAKESETKVRKVTRNEISRLPRCEWHLANNPFLVHGYHNYHHLAMIGDEENLKIGVPGIYHEKEEKVAKDFGFTEFLPIEDEEVMDEEEKFGYWCYPVRKCKVMENAGE